MPWITPIYDRKQSDVDLLKTLKNKINQLYWESLTVLEKENWFIGKGAIKYTDLNRIENNSLYLKEQLEQYGYLATVDVKLDWEMTDFLKLEDINRIKQNVINLIDGYYSLPWSPVISLVPTTLDFEQVNEIEKMLFDLDYILNNMIDGFRYCGTFVCGQEIVI